MPGEFFFMAIGGLGVSLAGFAGLISALDRRRAPESPIAAYRIRGIVVLGFSLTFIGLGTVALYTATENLTLTIRLASLSVALLHVRGLFMSRPGPVGAPVGDRRVQIAILVLLIAVTLGNVLVGSLGYLQLLMLLALGGPVSIFYNTVRDAGPSENEGEPG
jgi:hypothetical protein